MNTGPQSPAGAAQAAPADPADRCGRVADAILAATYPPDEWPDGPPGEGEMDTAREQATAALDALPELAAADQLRTALVALIEEMTDDATELGKASRAVRAEGNDAAASALTTRAGMTADLTDRLRALLEDT